ncbi:pyridoxamine 5'-phosphate oxidase family protein [Actinacidiphila glaucinigra]|uniref:pyridoxamine 5'-phosphate oxidase family protein n=1 Tax=Actinacidiphila glaucinigra TaxID=235986 RepID=UPI0035DD6C62
MSTAVRRMIEVSGAEALWLLEGTPGGRLVFIQRKVPVVRPAAHVLEYGRLIVRTPAPIAAFGDSATVTYHADQVSTTTGRGWSVTATGPAAVISDSDEAAHYRRTLMGWSHGPHDTLIRIHPQTVNGYRLGTLAPSSGVSSPGNDRPGSR